MHTSLIGRSPSQELIEYVEGTFIFRLTNGSRFLQEVSLDVGTSDIARSIKIDANKFTLKQTIILLIQLDY